MKEIIMAHKKMIIVMLGLVIIGGIWYFYRQHSIIADSGKEAAIPAVKAEKDVVAEGIVVPVNYSALSLPVGGVVSELYVKEGDKVKGGQLMARLVNEDIQARTMNSRAEKDKTSANLNQLTTGSRPQETAMKRAMLTQMQAGFDNAKANFERMEKLYSRGAVSLQELDQARSAYYKALGERDHAQADLNMAQEGARTEAIEVAKAEYESAAAKVQETEALLAQTELRAPFDGTVSYLDVKVGEYIAAGTVLVRLADLSKLQVRTDDLTELAIAKVKVGSNAVLTFDAIPELKLTGQVVHIRPFGEKKRGDMTYTVTIDPMQWDDRLKWNMTVSVLIENNESLL